jgi:hypothetical protein
MGKWSVGVSVFGDAGESILFCLGKFMKWRSMKLPSKYVEPLDEQVEKIYKSIEKEALEAGITKEDLLEVIDPDKPLAVNLKKVHDLILQW